MKNKKYQIIVVHHTHWDREWYFNEEAAKVISEENWRWTCKGLIKGNYPHFLIDDQQTIKDALNYVPNLAKLIKSGKIYTTPIFTQQDFFATTYQTVVRNIDHGLATFAKYNLNQPTTMYLPDSFGFSLGLNQALKAKGFKNMLTWRGIPREDIEKSVYLNWNGVNLYCMRETGYGGFWHFAMKDYCELRHDPLKLKAWFKNYYHTTFKNKIAEYKKRTPQECHGVIILPWGSDLAPVLYDSHQMLAWLNEFDQEASYQFGTIEQAFSLMDDAKLQIKSLELRHSSRSKIHRTIDSSRYSVKRLFRQAETTLYHILEPLKVIYFNYFGKEFAFSTGKEMYEQLLVSSSHDGLGGCSSDSTMLDVMNRLKRVIDNFETQIDLIKKHFAFNLNLKADDLLLWNLTPYPAEFNQVIETYSKNQQVSYASLEVEEQVLSLQKEGINLDYYHGLRKIKTHFTKGMSFKVVKALAKQPVIEKQLSQEVKMTVNKQKIKLQAKNLDYCFELAFTNDQGDTYDFSTDDSLTETSVSKTLDFGELVINNGQQILPFRAVLATGIVSGKIIVNLQLENDLINLQIVLNNQADNFKALLIFDLPKPTKQIEAMHQDLLIVRTNKKIPENWQQLYFDYPVNSFTTDSFIKLGQDHYLSTFGTNEFQFDKTHLLLTLMRSVPFLGRENLPFRPGVASGSPSNYVPTPLAKEQGIKHFYFKLNVAKGISDEKYYNKSVFNNLTYYQHKSSNNVFWRADYFSIIPHMDKLLTSPQQFISPPANKILQALQLENKQVKKQEHQLLKIIW